VDVVARQLNIVNFEMPTRAFCILWMTSRRVVGWKKEFFNLFLERKLLEYIFND